MARAMVVTTPGGPEAMRPADLPERVVGPGQVRVAVAAVGVNPVDAGNRADPGWAGVAAPYVVGYDLAGRVLEVGATVTDLAVGAEVWGLLPVRGTRWGTYATEVVVDAHQVAPRPPGLDVLEAAALPLAGATALQLLDRLDPGPGGWVLVHGAAGGVGHLLVQLCHARGARVAAVASAPRHPLLHRLGAEVVVDRHGPDPVGDVRRRTEADVDAVADLVGGRTLVDSLAVVAEGGRVGSVVGFEGDFDEAVDRNVGVHGVLVRPGREVLATLGALVSAGRLQPVLDEVLPLEDAARAHRRVETGSGQGKVVLSVDR